ncbi:MAG: cation-transporting P-type ATPase [Candidatus Pacearchaeota archaeon]|nr:cation-transporting P-type ATPase [Candidatus Pacearchaeota archaeon]
MKEKGLTEKEAKLRLQKYGFNEIKEIKLASPLKILLRQIKNNFIIYLLSVAMILAFVLGKNITAYTISAVICISVFVSFIQEYRAEKAIKALKEMIVPISVVIRDGKEKEIPSREIVPGDIILLRSGEKIPADCIVLEEKDLLVNEAVLTGESKEVKKKAVKNEKKYSEENMLFMGAFVINGKCVAKVVHTGMNTKFGKIAGMISETEKEMPLFKKTNKIAKYMVTVAIIFSILTGLVMILREPFPLSKEFLVNVLILIIALSVSAFPEGLPIVLITTLSVGAYRMAKKNAIVNRISTIETLGEVTVICVDKTGTITKGEMTVKKVFVNNTLFNISGSGYDAKGEFFFEGKKIKLEKEPVLELLIKTAVLCNDAKIERTGEDSIYKVSGMPTEAALLIMGAKAKIFREDLDFTRIEEIPFTSERKLMTVLCKSKKENYVFSKGAVEILLEKCKYIQRNNGVFRLTEKEKKKILKINKEMTTSMFRTLALAYKKTALSVKEHLEKDLIFLGIVAIEDPPREEVKEAIRLCKEAGIKVKMLTGDNKDTALAVAKEIGLSGKVMEGYELDKISEEELFAVVEEIVIFSRIKPEHKLKIVRALKRKGEVVMMTGDGVNDSPALKEAHVGVAMGKGGTDVAREVADLTLKDNNFYTVVEALKEGRTIFKNIRKFVSYQLSVNFAELSILFFGVLLAPFFGWAIPILVAIQILFMNLVTDDLPALTLALNPSSKDIMREKPRKEREILYRDLVKWMLVSSMLMLFFTLLSFYISFNILKKPTEYARTTALVTLIILEIVNAFNFRSFRKKVLTRSPLVNKWLFYASIASIVATLFVVYSLNKVFETTPIGIEGWLIALAAGFLIALFFDILKEINNKKRFFKLEF